MEILYTHCAGLDVHKKTIKVCLLTQGSNGQPHKEFRTYFTTTEELLKLSDWLKEQKLHICLRGNGVYWKPVLCNAALNALGVSSLWTIRSRVADAQ